MHFLVPDTIAEETVQDLLMTEQMILLSMDDSINQLYHEMEHMIKDELFGFFVSGSLIPVVGHMDLFTIKNGGLVAIPPEDVLKTTGDLKIIDDSFSEVLPCHRDKKRSELYTRLPNKRLIIKETLYRAFLEEMSRFYILDNRSRLKDVNEYIKPEWHKYLLNYDNLDAVYSLFDRFDELAVTHTRNVFNVRYHDEILAISVLGDYRLLERAYFIEEEKQRKQHEQEGFD
jgi:hypothetical protein